MRVDVARLAAGDGGSVAKEPVIKFEAIVSQVRTMADGGVRVQLDLPEDAIPQMAMLAETKRAGIVLTFEAKAKPDNRI